MARHVEHSGSGSHGRKLAKARGNGGLRLRPGDRTSGRAGRAWWRLSRLDIATRMPGRSQLLAILADT